MPDVGPGGDEGASFLEANRSGTYVHLASSSSTSARTAKLQAAVCCPFNGCPYARKHLSKDTLVSHLSARHVAGGQVVPPAVLQMLKHQLCTRCKTLHREGTPCQCHGSCKPTNACNASTPPSIPCPTSMPNAMANAPLSPHTPLSTACPPNLSPSFEVLLASRISTVRHVPGACRGAVALCLASLVESFVKHQSWESLHQLQCFPKLVLRAPKRAGKSHAKQVAHEISRRLHLFNLGELATLWGEATTTMLRDKPTRTRAQAKAQEGSLPRSVVQTIRGSYGTKWSPQRQVHPSVTPA